MTFDFLTGRLDRQGSSCSYMRAAGISEDEIASVEAAACIPSVLGINHYITSNRYLDGNVVNYPEECVGGNGRDCYADVEAVRAMDTGMAGVGDLLRITWDRFRLPLAVTEAHLGCTREEQLRWLCEIWTSAGKVRAEGVPVLAVTAWSLFGAYDWDSLLTSSRGCYEPGAFDLRSSPPRRTAVASLITDLAAGCNTRNPLASLPGWWRRNLRLLPHKKPLSPFPRISAAFTPLQSGAGRKPCPPLVITGGKGRLATAFARICYLRGIPYRVLGRTQIDIAIAASVRRVLDEMQPWGLINAAGYSQVDQAEKEEERCYRENVQGVKVVAAECARQRVKLMTFSTDQVFDGSKTGAYLEQDTPAPLSVFGRSKAEAERWALDLHRGALVIRSGSVFSEWDKGDFVVRAAQRLTSNEPVAAAKDLYISPTYLPDLVQACLDLLIDGETGVWHLNNTGQTTWAELAYSIAEYTASDPALVLPRSFMELCYPARRPRNATMTSSRGILLGDWRHGLSRCLEEVWKDLPLHSRLAATA